MRHAYEQQLSRSDEMPPVPGILSYLHEHVNPEEGRHLYERFLWELRREKEPRAALDSARFALAYAGATPPLTASALSELSDRIRRNPLKLSAGQNLQVAEGLKVVNLSDSQVEVSGHELLMAKSQVAAGGDLVVVIDESQPKANASKAQVVWEIPLQAEDSRASWEALMSLSSGSAQMPEWIEASTNSRHLVALGQLPSEHQVRAFRTRDFVKEVLMEHAYGPSSEQMTELDEDEVGWVLDQIDFFFDHYTSSPRLALSCRSLDDFSPLADWQQHGPAATAALIASVTGDDPLLVSALRSADRMRIGTLAFTGDPDNNGDDLLSAVLPPQECSVVLRPEVLAQTLFLSGTPHPGADLPVPQRRHGFYNTLAVGKDVREMLKTRAYLGLTPADNDSVRDYFQGRSQEIQLEETTANPAFQALVTAVMVRRRQGEDNPMVKAALRVAAAHSIYVSLIREPSQDAIGGVHLGALGLSDVEQVVIPLADGDEWRDYHRSGNLPGRLRKSQSYLQSFDIKLRGRAPAGHGSMALGT